MYVRLLELPWSTYYIPFVNDMSNDKSSLFTRIKLATPVNVNNFGFKMFYNLKDLAIVT